MTANAHRPTPDRLAVPAGPYPTRAPSPAKQLPLKTSRESSYLQSLFVGLAFNTTPAKSGEEGLDDLHWFIAVSDGFAIQDSEHGRVEGVDLRPGSEGPRRTIGRIIDRLRQYAASQSYKIQLVAISEAGLPKCFQTEEPLLLPALWQKLDTIPFLIPIEAFAQTSSSPTASPSASFFPPSALRQTVPRRRHIDLSFLPEAATDRAEGEDRAQRAVREAVKALSPLVKTSTTVDTDGQTGEVEVDRNGQIQLASLADYEATTSPKLWAKFLALSEHLKANKIRVSFFSATPQGGGVALMRHALIRLWRLVGVDAKWFVPEGHPVVWSITKTRFHNVLQGVNKPDTVLEAEHKEIFEKWTVANLETFWSEGAIEGRVVVIDDPQLSALIPHIRERYPDVKVLFRSHIQIDTSLTDVADDDKSAHPARDVWSYLWSFIREADLFIAHPVRRFVPQVVTDSDMPVTYMPPSTDPLDGLNKPIGAADMQYWRQYFSRISEQQCGVGVDWARPYIMQVARFDPSKGIPVLLKAYLAFRQKLQSLDPEPSSEQIPQLVIAGHGSVDDVS